MSCRRGHRHDRWIDRGGDRAGSVRGASRCRGRRSRRPAGRWGDADRSRGGSPLPLTGDDRRDLSRPARQGLMEPDAVELRVVACLVEKQRTTPDAYPLSLNALRLACNQSTNRDPVASYDEATVVEALRRLALRGWSRLASGAGSRARKYRHLLPEALGVDDGELALLAVLMLRGPQTPGELKGRAEPAP